MTTGLLISISVILTRMHIHIMLYGEAFVRKYEYARRGQYQAIQQQLNWFMY